MRLIIQPDYQSVSVGCTLRCRKNKSCQPNSGKTFCIGLSYGIFTSGYV